MMGCCVAVAVGAVTGVVVVMFAAAIVSEFFDASLVKSP